MGRAPAPSSSRSGSLLQRTFDDWGPGRRSAGSLVKDSQEVRICLGSCLGAADAEASLPSAVGSRDMVNCLLPNALALHHVTHRALLSASGPVGIFPGSWGLRVATTLSAPERMEPSRFGPSRVHAPLLMVCLHFAGLSPPASTMEVGSAAECQLHVTVRDTRAAYELGGRGLCPCVTLL